MANTVEAEKWYAKAIMGKQDAEVYYNYVLEIEWEVCGV
jgi:hypothetical protein